MFEDRRRSEDFPEVWKQKQVGTNLALIREEWEIMRMLGPEEPRHVG